ncbi:MAG: TSUP family transporter [Verrucomicrobia bacterium]|nr:TSUP family transporter [Verrucomicrobiota bacterium]
MRLLWLLPILFATGFVAGFIDAIAGGGGLITVPVLLGIGLPPQAALATNKLQSSFGSASATWHYARAGLVHFRECRAGIGFTAAGALLGTSLVQWLPTDWLSRAIPVLLVLIALYQLFCPRFGAVDAQARVGPGWFAAVCGLGLGFYDGFFGPGTGTFWAMAYLLGLGFNLTKATAHTKVMNFTSNVVSLAVFLAGHQVQYAAGLVMGIGQMAGARAGSRSVIRRGAGLIRPVFLAVVLLLTFKLVRQAYFAP